MNFGAPLHLFWLIPALALAVWLVREERAKREVLRRFLESPMLARLAAGFEPRRALAVLGLRIAALLLLILALAAPQWGAQMTRVEREGMDIIFVVDCSQSMRVEDLRPNRMEAAKRELSVLMERLQGNRMGLVGFAGAPFPFCPLTLDLGATQLFLKQLDENAVQVPGTAIGDAVRLALEMFPKDSTASRAIILITDGEDHHSEPLEAAKEAAAMKVSIYAVGIGSPTGEPVPSPDGGLIRDRDGKVVISKLDEETLKQMAQMTGGTYVHAGKGLDPLSPLVSAINGSEKQKLESQMVLRYQERYQLFAGLALALLVLAQSLTVRVRRHA